MSDLLLTVYLHPPVLQTAQAGKLGIVNRIRALLEPRAGRSASSGPAPMRARRLPTAPAMRCSTWNVRPMTAR
ncbi:hypothetical protein FLP41_03985 [Paracoccus marcusii]|uniref:hypothetical protein n=1 Tax=Paracoccus marcusii TaxID=59779 RepID=UPI002ED32C83|nr:hypothetical protein FLP41_03985 [Paracoccus marcusii]